MKATLHSSRCEITRDADILLVLGDGDTMKDDLGTFLQWLTPHDVAALGRGIKQYPGPVKHWMNADGETAIAWAKKLTNGNGTIRHTLGECDGFDVDWDVDQPDYHFETITGQRGRLHGSSAMFATLAGLAIGYEKIILAGCPLDHGGHWYFADKNKETLGPVWLGADLMAWIDFREQAESSRVRSMSGYTAKILGRADISWLRG